MTTPPLVNYTQALKRLKEGNIRFQKDFRKNREILDKVKENSKGQSPFATILSCIDSRMPAEMIFDQGIGDIFSIRIAGNFVNQDILGSMEFGSIVSTTRLIVVMGHTSCGAIKGACDNVELGNLTAMLRNLHPAIDAVKEPTDPNQRNGMNIAFTNDVAEQNVHLTIKRILNESEALREMVDNEELLIVGALYDISNGVVTFFD